MVRLSHTPTLTRGSNGDLVPKLVMLSNALLGGHAKMGVEQADSSPAPQPRDKPRKGETEAQGCRRG